MDNADFVWIDWGMAYTDGNKIYLNRALKKDGNVLQKIVEHEYKHINGQELVDWKERFDLDIFLFQLKHPKTWVQELPVWIREGKVSIDLTRAGLWLLTGAMGLLILGAIML